MGTTNPSTVVSVSERKELQVWFDRALRLASSPPYDTEIVNDLLGECVRRDPGNSIYADAYLTNLGQRRAARIKHRRGWFAGRSLHGALKRHDWETVVAAALRLLDADPSDGTALHALTLATWDWKCEEAACQFARAAAEMSPADNQIQSTFAKVLMNTGQLAAALDIWKKIDSEQAATARQILEAQTVAPELLKSWEDLAAGRGDATRERQHEAAQDAVSHHCFELALAICQTALSASPGDQKTYALMEDIRIEQIDDQCRRGQRLIDQGLAESALAARLASSLNRVRLEVFANRHARRPSDMENTFQLAGALREGGNLAEACAKFELLLESPLRRAEALVQMGECAQSMHQFEVARQHYERALSLPDTESETRQRAVYRAAVLDAASGNLDKAEGFFRQLPNDYRQTADHLDKIEQMRHKREFPPADKDR